MTALPIDIPEFAFRVLARPDRGSWSVLLVDARQEAMAVEELLRECQSLSDQHVRAIAWSSLADTVSALQKSGTEIAIITGVGALSSSDWSRLDLARSRLQRDGEVVLVLPREAMEALAQSAAHLFSWIGGNVWELDEAGLIQRERAQREHRLEDLRRATGLTDCELIAKAEAHELPPEPEYAEWLALLGRGDLIVPR